MTEPDQPVPPFWPRRSPAFSALRRRVRETLPLWLPDGTEAPATLTVGVSGGADSLALVAACAAEARNHSRLTVHAAIVDHQLQEATATVARDTAKILETWGITTHVITVEIPRTGTGPEDAARQVRHGALREEARRVDVGKRGFVALAHTTDDQAETVLLGMARGSGAAALSGMPTVTTWDDGVTVIRPLLHTGTGQKSGARRSDTQETCRELGVSPWHDPHNDDPRYTRVRVRQALPLLTETLGADTVTNLARTADHLRRDNELLDELAEQALPDVSSRHQLHPATTALPGAIRTRVLKRWAEAGGADPLSAVHVEALDRLLSEPSILGPVSLPGRVVVSKVGASLSLREAPRPNRQPERRTNA